MNRLLPLFVPIGSMIALLGLTGCTSSDEPPTTTPSPTPSISAESLTPEPTTWIDSETGETITPNVVPVWDDEARTSALDAATAALTAFARPDLDYETWWAELEPLLTVDAAMDYSFVDPVNIPVRSVEGPATLEAEGSAYLADVSVPTDAGVYVVTLVRADGASPWLVVKFLPPGD